MWKDIICDTFIYIHAIKFEIESTKLKACQHQTSIVYISFSYMLDVFEKIKKKEQFINNVPC